jgi:hypothetical protein
MPADQHDSIHEQFPVGAIVRIEKRFFEDDGGSIGVVYEHYSLGKEHKGCSIITASGAYDGFSTECLKIWGVTALGYCESLGAYQFTNVNQLCVDFHNGVFEAGFVVRAHH